MPRPGDPKIKTGSGKANQNSVDANSFTTDLAKGVGGSPGFKAHVNDPQAHPASAITTTTSGGLYNGGNVQGNLDEIGALIPPRPPTLGDYVSNFNTTFALSGIPDWGVLKLWDAGHVARGSVFSPDPSDPNDDSLIYPYYNDTPAVADEDPPFSPVGNDPATDPVFNLDPAGTGDPTYHGGGPGRCHQGGFTRPQLADSPVIETMRVFPTAGGAFQPVVISGVVYPADRGVLALLHWPAGGTIGDFLAQPLTERVIAALRLGQGLLDDCDGAPGGIFTNGDPDIFTYPGRATGQYDLHELHTGLVDGVGPALEPPFDTPDPSAGQVRLGQDPNAGVAIVPGGIPVLGGTTAALGQDGSPHGGNDNNFFRYRLPYLEDYSSATGLGLTPASERPRYFNKPPVAQDHLVPLEQAGAYPDLPQRYWEFQVARYRHQFTFLTNVPPAPDPIDQGSWLLVHFKRERDFEAYVRDGVLPDDLLNGYEIYSSSLLDFSDPEATDNLAEPAAPNATSSGYHVLRAAVLEEPAPFDTVTVDSINFLYDPQGTDEVVAVSGIKYFVPGSAANKWTITHLSFSLSDMWQNSYRLGGAGPETTAGLEHQFPIFVFVGMYGAESGSTVPPGGTASFAGEVRGGPGGERVEFRYDQLDLTSLHGPFTLTNGPLPSDKADVALGPADPMTFNGDQEFPHFSTDARVRGFVRKPLGHMNPDDTSIEVLFPRPGGARILFHSTAQNPTDDIGQYGNFQVGGPGTLARASLETPRKDVEERFLDEVYRWSGREFFTGAADPTWDGAVGNLVGPGLPFGLNGFLSLPVRVGGEPIASAYSFIQQDGHLADLTAPLNREAQVAGLPDRNPPISDGVIAPVSSRGVLIYPQTDYTTGHRPSLADGDITDPQFDYSGILAGGTTRAYIRAFDVGFSRDPSPVVTQVAGQSLFRMRFYGITLSDFAYSAPGPGSIMMGIQIKVPGLTTWMDAGRIDGSGPSKQDPQNDGAGCQVVGPQTLDSRDPHTGEVRCDVLINVGPSATLMVNDFGEIPVLVMVFIRPDGVGLNWTQGGSDGSVADVRGLAGIEVLRPE